MNYFPRADHETRIVLENLIEEDLEKQYCKSFDAMWKRFTDEQKRKFCNYIVTSSFVKFQRSKWK